MSTPPLIPPQGQYEAPAMLYDKVVTELDIVSDNTEQTIYTKSIGARDLGLGGILRLTIVGDYFNNSGGTRTLHVKVKFGSTTLYDDTTISIAAAAERYPVFWQIYLLNRGDAASQWLGGLLMIGNRPATTGIGELATDEIAANAPIGGTATEDTTSAKTFSVTVTHSASNASLSFRREVAILEMM